jgi:predicted O-methyltransferase YrrM
MTIDPTTPVTSELAAIEQRVPGWVPADQMLALYLTAWHALTELPGELWEVGSWCGRSTQAMALAARDAGHGQVHSIDLFPHLNEWREHPDGSRSLEVHCGEGVLRAFTQHPLWREPYERDVAPLYQQHGPDLHATFRRFLAEQGLDAWVRSYRGTAAGYAGRFSGHVAMAFLDGDHDYDAVCADIGAVEPFLLPGAWLCFDDAHTSYEGVSRAIGDRILRSGRYVPARQITRKLFAARYRG